MKTAVLRHLNDIISLTVLALMAVALVAGQLETTAAAVDAEMADQLHVSLEIQLK